VKIGLWSKLRKSLVDSKAPRVPAAPRRDIYWQTVYVLAQAPGAALFSVAGNALFYILGLFSDTSSSLATIFFDFRSPPVLNMAIFTVFGVLVSLLFAGKYLTTDSWVRYGAERCLPANVDSTQHTEWLANEGTPRLHHHRVQLTKFLRTKLGVACDDFILHVIAGDNSLPQDWRLIDLDQVLEAITLRLSDEVIEGKTTGLVEYVSCLGKSLVNLVALRDYLLKTFKSVPAGYVARVLGRGKRGPLAVLERNGIAATVTAAIFGALVSASVPSLLRLLIGS